MSLYINSTVHIGNTVPSKNGAALLPGTPGGFAEPQDLYRALGCSYPKFFKMDMLCKWAWLGAEVLLHEDGKAVYDGIDKTKIAVVLQTNHGSLDVDKKYLDTMHRGVASPALFVYTLPNIMLGEIAIRHGFKGEQLCTVAKTFDIEEMHFWVADLLNNRGMEACLCGQADVHDEQKDICLFWVTKENNGLLFTTDSLNKLYQQ